MTREQLDDTIDRVARQLTLSPADLTLSAAVRHAFAPSPTSVLNSAGLQVAAAVVVFVVAFAAWQLPGNRAGEIREAATALESRTLAPVARLATAVDRKTPIVRAVVAPRMPLEVAPLSIAPLSVEAIRELEPLRVEDITVSEIQNGEIKEHK